MFNKNQLWGIILLCLWDVFVCTIDSLKWQCEAKMVKTLSKLLFLVPLRTRNSWNESMCLESTIFYYFAAWCIVVAMATHRLAEAETYWSFTLPPSQWKVLFNHWTMKLDSKPSEVANSVKGSQSFLLNSDQRIAESASSIFWFPLELFLQSYKEFIAALVKGQW